MPNRPMHAVCIAIAGSLALSAPLHAQPSTPHGQISVAQVKAMLDQAATNPTARQVLTAYLGGAGETAGWLIDAARDRGVLREPCKRPLSLDANQARAAIAGGSSAAPTETPATPLIISDMLKRAGCRLE